MNGVQEHFGSRSVPIGQLLPVDDMKIDFIVRLANQLSYLRRR